MEKDGTLDRVMRPREVCERLSLSRTTVWRMTRDGSGSFPKPIRLGPNSVGWRESEIQEWIDSRKAV